MTLNIIFYHINTIHLNLYDTIQYNIIQAIKRDFKGSVLEC